MQKVKSVRDSNVQLICNNRALLNREAVLLGTFG